MKPFTILARLLLVTGVFTGLAMADYTLDFNMAAPTSGTITYAGGANPLVGSGINVDTVIALNGTPKNGGVTQECLNCVLDFSTGSFVGYSGMTWLFAPGGTITLTGTLDVNNNHIVDAGDITGTFLTGTFGDSPQVLGFSGGFSIAAATFTDTVNSDLAAYFGLPTEAGRLYAGGLNLSFLSQGAAGGAFSSMALLSGDITDSVPEPVSIVLLGTVLVGCTVIARRRRSTARPN